MKNIKFTLFAFLVGIFALWLFATPFPDKWGVFPVRNLLLQFTGSISILAMSACMILAVRPKMLEELFGGLDKMYRLHKWLGIVALSGSILHWTSKQFPKWLVKLGLFDGKKPPRPLMQEVLTLKDWLVTQRHFAEEVGEIAFYVAVVLLVIALIKLIPYRWFAKLHILIVPVYLALVWHTIVLANFTYWAQPLGWLLATALFFGSICSLLALFKRIGKPQTATVTAMNQNGSLLSLTLNAPKWQGHQAGQFLFLRAHGESHPFTIASNWNPENQQINLIIKDLGDYTHRLPQRLNIGDTVQIDGAYGHFNFSDKNEQIWVSNGIGFTPFLARLKELAKQPSNQPIDWFHTDRNLSAEIIDQWKDLAQQANVTFHYIPSETQRLSADYIAQSIQNSETCSLWLCGSRSFTSSIAGNLKTRSLHQELFEFR